MEGKPTMAKSLAVRVFRDVLTGSAAALLWGSFGVALMGLGARPASASVTTVISGADLSGLDYRPNGGTAEYVAGTPDVAYLYTPDSGLTGSAPVVFVNASNAGLPSLGTLGSFSASYDLLNSDTPSGTTPYWLTYLVDPGGGYVGVVSFGGPDLNGSSQIHVLCDYANASTCPNDTEYFGDTLATLDSIAYGSTTFGQLTVYEAGVEIGDWNNNGVTIPADASIQSITISLAAVPEPASLTLFGAALAGLGFVRRKRAA
jgi:hypothetical protein